MSTDLSSTQSQPVEYKRIKKNVTIALSMIVKNESHIIQRCLESFLPLVDYYVISDTGSTDNTIEKIREFYKKYNVNGEVLEHKWINFATNRNLSLEVARKRADYVFFIDADEELEILPISYDEELKFNDMSYVIQNVYKPDNVAILNYVRLHIIKSDYPNSYHGNLHEKIDELPSTPHSVNMIKYFTIVNKQDGYRTISNTKYVTDLEVLNSLLENEPDNEHALFYKGRTLLRMHKPKEAIEYYNREFKTSVVYNYISGLEAMKIYNEEGRSWKTQEYAFQFSKAIKDIHMSLEPYFLQAYNMFTQGDINMAYILLNLYKHIFDIYIHTDKKSLFLPEVDTTIYDCKFVALYCILHEQLRPWDVNNVVYKEYKTIYNSYIKDKDVNIKIEKGSMQLINNKTLREMQTQYINKMINISNPELIVPNGFICPKDFTLETARNTNYKDKIAFIGTLSNERVAKIKFIADKLNKIIDIYNNVFYDAYNIVVNRYDQFLNVHFKDNTILEISRLTSLISNGKLVISDRSLDKELDNMYEPYVLWIDDVLRSNWIIDLWLLNRETYIEKFKSDCNFKKFMEESKLINIIGK